jgi:hypothetical protein
VKGFVNQAIIFFTLPPFWRPHRRRETGVTRRQQNHIHCISQLDFNESFLVAPEEVTLAAALCLDFFQAFLTGAGRALRVTGTTMQCHYLLQVGFETVPRID